MLYTETNTYLSTMWSLLLPVLFRTSTLAESVFYMSIAGGRNYENLYLAEKVIVDVHIRDV